MARTASAVSPVRAVVAIAFLLALATPLGRQIFDGATTWAGQVAGQMFMHSLDHTSTATSGSSADGTR